MARRLGGTEYIDLLRPRQVAIITLTGPKRRLRSLELGRWPWPAPGMESAPRISVTIPEAAMCVVCYVDEAMRSKIIAYNAEFHKVSKSPYGKDDEIGMLNLIDAQSRSAILSRADASKVFDLSVDNFIGMPGWFAAGDQPYQIWMTHTPAGEVVANSMGATL